MFVGDTFLDIQLARGLGIPSLLIVRRTNNSKDAGQERRSKMGSTYNCGSFDEILKVIKSPDIHRLVLEDRMGTAAARIYTDRNINNGYTLIRGLGRQQQGPCDAYGAIGKYYKFGNENRTEGFLGEVAHDVSRYLHKVIAYKSIRWDMITCVADKAMTKPLRKMAKLLYALEVDLPKKEFFVWPPGFTGSIRQEKTRTDRMRLIEQFVHLESDANLEGKNVIVIDDQYTTGATAASHIGMLRKKGVQNILFIVLFYLTDKVSPEKICPKCGNIVQIKYHKRDGTPFYNCLPPDYNGTGWRLDGKHR